MGEGSGTLEGEIAKVDSMVGDHDSNGEAEQAVQKIEDEVRTFKDALNDAIKDRIPPSHDILAWMVDHVASIYRRVVVGVDGKTPMERIRGRKGRDIMAEFGEYVHYMPLRGDVDDKRQAKADMAPRFIYGVFLGLSDRSDELVVFNKTEGVRKARTIRRLPDEQRWNRDALLEVQGSPLLPNPGQSDHRIRTKMDPGIPEKDDLHAPITKEEIAREAGESRPFYLMRSDVRQASKTIG